MPLRIAYLSYSPLQAGVANAVHVMNMCSAFAGHGHETVLFARGSSRSSDHSQIFADYGVSNAFELRLRSAPRLKVIGRLSYAFRQSLHARRHGQADLYYARCLVSAAFVLLMGGSIVLEVHELPHTPLERLVQRFVLRHRGCRRLVVISQALLEDLGRLHGGVLDDVHCVVAPDGANVRGPSAPFPLDRGPGRQIGYAGGLREGNGIGLVLALAEAFPRDTFHMLGGSPQDLAHWQRMQRTPNVAWYGRSPPARVAAFLTACDVLLAPYEHGAKTSSGNDTSKWMSPLKIFEYMAAGKAMIVSDFPVLREVLSDDVAKLVEPGNLAAWKEALVQLDEEGVRRQLGEAARESLETRYTWAARARSVLEGLDEAPARPRRTPGPESLTAPSAGTA